MKIEVRLAALRAIISVFYFLFFYITISCTSYMK